MFSTVTFSRTPPVRRCGGCCSCHLLLGLQAPSGQQHHAVGAGAQVKRVKQVLSANSESSLSVEEMHNGVDFRSHITREAFEVRTDRIWEFLVVCSNHRYTLRGTLSCLHLQHHVLCKLSGFAFVCARHVHLLEAWEQGRQNPPPHSYTFEQL